MNTLGKKLAYVFYRTAFDGFRLGVRLRSGPTHSQVWARNSFYLGNWIPLKSDIDLSVWMAKEPTKPEIERLLRTHRLVKAAFPILGEMNLYVGDDLPWIEQTINLLELERDPLLAKKVTYRGTLEPRYHAAAFLLRMLESDIDRVLREPEGRRPKWDAHFQRATKLAGGKDLDIWRGFPERTLLRGILDLISFQLDVPQEERASFTEQLELYYQSIGRKVPVYVLNPLLRERPYLWAAFPHRFCFQQQARPVLKDWMRELAQAQVSWELFGLITQHRLWKQTETERAGMRTHLGSLRAFYQETLLKGSAHPDLDEAAELVLKKLSSE